MTDRGARATRERIECTARHLDRDTHPLSLVVSIVAFTFGVFTWMVAERAREGSELREARAELTSTLDELATIQAEFEMESARAGVNGLTPDNSTLAAAANQLQRRTILISSARTVMQREANVVTATDRLALADALAFVADYGGALVEYREAARIAVTFGDLVLAERGAGSAALLVGDPERAAGHHRRALEADLRFPRTPAQTVAFNRVVTHVRWSVALGFTGACDSAEESFDAALLELEQRNENEWRLYRSEVMGQAGWYATYCSPVDDTFVQRLAAMGYV